MPVSINSGLASGEISSVAASAASPDDDDDSEVFAPPDSAPGRSLDEAPGEEIEGAGGTETTIGLCPQPASETTSTNSTATAKAGLTCAAPNVFPCSRRVPASCPPPCAAPWSIPPAPLAPLRRSNI